MIRRKNGLLTLVFLTVLLFAGISNGEELPKPGVTIDKNNYKNYAHLFPPEVLPAFEDGFGGLIPHLHFNVVATKPTYNCETYLQFSKKNMGKYKLDAEGDVINFDRQGLPFPDLDRNDKDFVLKLMWNYDNAYMFDETSGERIYSYEKRKREKVRTVVARAGRLFFTNRMFVPPKPSLPNPMGLFYATRSDLLYPESMKNMAGLDYRFIDVKKKDQNFSYIPSMRRVIRTDSGQRSTPMGGAILSRDDTNGFQGRIPEFTYKLIGEQKILGVTESDMTQEKAKGAIEKDEIPFAYDNYEVKDVYVIEIKSKDPMYPQSKKVIYIDKINPYVLYYAVAWDRAGKPWKIFWTSNKTFPLGMNDKVTFGAENFDVDVQYGIADFILLNNDTNKANFRYEQFLPSALLMFGK